MDKKINLFGDSHTYGNGLPDCGLEQPWAQHSCLTWPYQIFDKDKINNYSYPGCSNETIALKLVRHTTQEHKVMIMFTFPERLHLIRKGYNFVVNQNGTQSISDNGSENWIAQQIAEADYTKNKNYMLDNFDDNFLEIIYLKNILYCQNFCESNNIEYYFTLGTARPKTKMQGSLEKYRDSLHTHINWKNIFLVNGKYGFEEYALKTNAEKGSDNSHFGLEYNRLFGKLFLDWILEKKQV